MKKRIALKWFKKQFMFMYDLGFKDGELSGLAFLAGYNAGISDGRKKWGTGKSMGMIRFGEWVMDTWLERTK